MYALNVLDEPEESADEKDEADLIACASIVNTRPKSKQQEIIESFERLIIPNDKDVDQTELVEIFAKILWAADTPAIFQKSSKTDNFFLKNQYHSEFEKNMWFWSKTWLEHERLLLYDL